MKTRIIIRRWPARFTVEASLLMLLIIPFLIAIIMAGFYIHDRTYMQGVSGEMAAMGSNLRIYENGSSLLHSRASGRLRRTLTWSRAEGTEVSADSTSVSAVSKSTFRVPGLAAKMFGFDSLLIEASASRRLLNPSSLIWKVRAAHFLLDQALGSS